jgi:hypothetical protein
MRGDGNHEALPNGGDADATSELALGIGIGADSTVAATDEMSRSPVDPPISSVDCVGDDAKPVRVVAEGASSVLSECFSEIRSAWW